ncbi:hypothetical protein [Methanococcoides sp.]|uniref:hypothetical protein n=1 Tax=Methanococcoides sp. TaxID=1966350 RepID=UPI00272E4522|nr:hypothetical protein [Methanococcoides sp.]
MNDAYSKFFFGDGIGDFCTDYYRWKKIPEFLAKVDELTLDHENATRAGLLRECYKGLDLKRGKIEQDKNTHLHYVQEIADLKGLKKQKVEHSGSVEHYWKCSRLSAG